MHCGYPSAAARSAVLLLFLLPACGGDDGGGGNGPGDNLVIAKAAPSGDGQTATVGEALTDPLRVLVTLDGTPEVGRTVAWTALAGQVAPPSSVTGADGIASTAWTLGNTSGGQTARATLGGAAGSPLTFNATAEAGPAANMIKGEGDNQAGRTGTAAATPLIVRIRDAFDNGVPGANVTFAVTAGNGQVAPLTDATDADGNAQTILTFGAPPGPITVQASVAGLAGSPQSFSAEGGHVQVVNNQFQPGALAVPAGTTVRWVWVQGATEHNVVPDATEPTSSTIEDYPFIYQYTFTTPGTYDYHCTVHAGMSGTITVN